MKEALEKNMLLYTKYPRAELKNLILLFEMHQPWNTAATTRVSAFGNPRAKQTKSLHVPARNI